MEDIHAVIINVLSSLVWIPIGGVLALLGCIKGGFMIRLRVKEIAEEKNVSMTRLAKLSDVDYKTVRKLFRDPTSEIGLSTLDKLAWALQVEPADLCKKNET